CESRKGPGNAYTVGRIGPGAVGNMAFLDMPGGATHGSRGIVEEHLLLLRRHRSKEVAGLLPMIIVDAMVPMGRLTLDRHRRLGEIGLVLPKPRAVGMIGERCAQI